MSPLYIFAFLTGSSAIYNSFYGKARGLLYMTSVQCNGRESKLTECYNSPLALSSCGDGQYAGVQCLGKFSLGKLK